VPPRGFRSLTVKAEVVERLEGLARRMGVGVSKAILRLIEVYESRPQPEANPVLEKLEALEERLDYLEEKLNRILELLGGGGEELGFAPEASSQPKAKPREQEPSPASSPTNPSSKTESRFNPDEFLRRVEEAGGIELGEKPRRVNPRDLFIVLSNDNIPPEEAREALGLG